MTVHEPVTTPQVAKLTAEDFLLLDRSGAFDAYAKAELINGTIYVVNAQHRPHARAKTRLAMALADALKAFPELDLLIEGGVAIGANSICEPDIIVTDEAEGAGLVPLASVKLAIEIGDSSIRFDLGEKAALYALNAIAEYWVLDVDARTLHQFWSPAGDRYVESRSVPWGELVEATTISGLSLSTEGL